MKNRKLSYVTTALASVVLLLPGCAGSPSSAPSAAPAARPSTSEAPLVTTGDVAPATEAPATPAAPAAEDEDPLAGKHLGAGDELVDDLKPSDIPCWADFVKQYEVMTRQRMSAEDQETMAALVGVGAEAQEIPVEQGISEFCASVADGSFFD